MGILRELLDAEAATTRRAVQARSRRTVRLSADARQLRAWGPPVQPLALGAAPGVLLG